MERDQKAGEILSKLWRWVTVGVGAIALAAGLAVAATPAGATPEPTIQVMQSQHYLAPASCTSNRNYKGGWATFTYCDDQFYRVECSQGAKGDIFGPLYAANGCSTQLRMNTSSMTVLCVDPRRSTNVLKKNYEEYAITGDTGPC
jgi:hypothetical protein